MNSTNAEQMLKNIFSNLDGSFITMFDYGCYAIAIVVMVQAFLKLIRSQEQGSKPGGGLALVLLAGALAGMPDFINLFGTTMFGSVDMRGSLSQVAGNNVPTVAKQAIQTAMLIIRIVGCVAIYKGLARFRYYSMGQSDPRMVSEGTTLLAMGTCAVFMPQFLKMIGNTVGGSVQQVIADYIVA